MNKGGIHTRIRRPKNVFSSPSVPLATGLRTSVEPMGDERSPHFQHGGQYIDVGEQRNLGGGRRNRLAGKPTCSPEAAGFPLPGWLARVGDDDYYYCLPHSAQQHFIISALPSLHACADLTWHGLARSARKSGPMDKASEFNLTSLHYGELCAAAAEAAGHCSKKRSSPVELDDRGRARRTSSVPASLHASGVTIVRTRERRRSHDTPCVAVRCKPYRHSKFESIKLDGVTTSFPRLHAR